MVSHVVQRYKIIGKNPPTFTEKCVPNMRVFPVRTSAQLSCLRSEKGGLHLFQGVEISLCLLRVDGHTYAPDQLLHRDCPHRGRHHSHAHRSCVSPALS